MNEPQDILLVATENSDSAFERLRVLHAAVASKCLQKLGDAPIGPDEAAPGSCI